MCTTNFFIIFLFIFIRHLMSCCQVYFDVVLHIPIFRFFEEEWQKHHLLHYKQMHNRTLLIGDARQSLL